MSTRQKIVPITLPKHDIPAQVYGLSLFLTIVPFVMSFRFAASAIWSEPVPFDPFQNRLGFALPLIVAAVACVFWSVMYTSIRAHAYLGGLAALASMFRCVSAFSTRGTLGTTAYTAATVWATTAVVCMMTAMIGVQYASGWHHPDHPRWKSEKADVRG